MVYTGHTLLTMNKRAIMLLAKFYIRVITGDLLTSLSFFRGGTG